MVSTSVNTVNLCQNEEPQTRFDEGFDESFQFEIQFSLLHRTSISLHKGKQKPRHRCSISHRLHCDWLQAYNQILVFLATSSSSTPHTAQDKIRYRTQAQKLLKRLCLWHCWRWRVVTSKNQPIQSKMTAINGERSRIGTSTRQLGRGGPAAAH